MRDVRDTHKCSDYAALNLSKELAAMKARAEKAEAELATIRDALTTCGLYPVMPASVGAVRANVEAETIAKVVSLIESRREAYIKVRMARGDLRDWDGVTDAEAREDELSLVRMAINRGEWRKEKGDG